MKTLAAVVALVPLLSFAGFPPAWRQVESGTTENLKGVAVLSETTAVVVGVHGVILRSEDAGESWSAIEVGPTNLSLNAVAFSDELRGFAVGQDLDTYESLVLRSEDGGRSWRRQESASFASTALRGVHAVDANTAIAVGDDGLRTDDGGETWVVIDRPTCRDAVSFIDADNGIAVGWRFSRPPSGAICATSDGGRSWSVQAFGAPLYGVAFSDVKRGTAVGHRGIVVRTIDGGQTWQVQFWVTNSGRLNSVAYYGPLGVTVGVRNEIGETRTAWTFDAGESWTEVDAPFALNSVALFSLEKAVAVGGPGLVLVAP